MDNWIIGDIALVLLRLAGNKIGPPGHQGLVNFVDQGRFADAGLTGDQKSFIGAAGHPVERGHQFPDFGFPAEKLLRHVKTNGAIYLSGDEVSDLAKLSLFPRTLVEIGHCPIAALVPVFYRLGQQLHDDFR